MGYQEGGSLPEPQSLFLSCYGRSEATTNIHLNETGSQKNTVRASINVAVDVDDNPEWNRSKRPQYKPSSHPLNSKRVSFQFSAKPSLIIGAVLNHIYNL